MLNPFTWIRRMTRDAILGGFDDAIAIVSPAGMETPPSLLEQRAAQAVADKKDNWPDDVRFVPTTEGNKLDEPAPAKPVRTKK